VRKSMLHEAVFREGPELWPRVCYMDLCVDRDLTVTNSMFHETVCRERPELRPTVCYMKLCVDRDLTCDQKYVT